MSSLFNKTKAVSCPQSWDEYLEAASKLCPQIDGEYNYICVPNQNKTELVQFCFRSGKFPAWQLAEHCPYLHNTGNMNAENCTSFSNGCPQNHYKTREIYKYPACLEVNTERGCYIADSNCIYNESTPLTSSMSPAETEHVFKLALSVALGLMAFCLLITIIVYFVYIRRQRNNRKKKQKHTNRYENIDLLEKSNKNDCDPNGDTNVSSHDIEEGGRYNSGLPIARINIIQESKTKTNALHTACMAGKTQMCQHLINRYPEMLNQEDDDGWNAALYTALGGNVEILELLAEKGVDMTYKTKDACNILHIACENSTLEMCQYIIQHYPDMLNQVNNDGWNAALYAATGGNVEILELLAEKGVDMKHKSKNGTNILHMACNNSRLKICKHIIQQYPDMLNQVNNEGWNAAFYATKGGNVEILELLSDKGVNMRHKSKSGTILPHIACNKSRLEMCKHVVYQLSDILNLVDNRGNNAAFYAVRYGNVEILELLAEKGVDMKHKNKNGCNIMHIACEYPNLVICLHIIQQYPDMLEQVSHDGNNAALYAAQGGDVEILKHLAEIGVQMTYKNKFGCNILHIACINSKFELCQHIIQHYPDLLKEVNNDGWNAAFYAAYGGNVKILELLEEKRINMKHEDKYGSNILHIACKNSTLEMCQYIVQHYPDMLNQVDDKGWHCALYAAQGGNVKIIELLEKKGVELT